MKTKAFITCLLLLICSMAVAQQINYGFAGGLSLNNFHDDDNNDPEYSNKSGAQIGVFLEYQLLENLSIQPEFLFNTKGGNVKYTLPAYDNSGNYVADYNYKYECQYEYLELPILLKYHYQVPVLEVQPYLGLSLGYLIRAKEVESIGISTAHAGYEQSNTNDVMDFMNKPESSLCAGFDVKFSNKVFGGIRYNHGLSKIYEKYENQETGYTYQSPRKTKQLMVRIGYAFH